MGVMLALCACGGDPRADFIGVYRGSGTKTATFGDGTTDVDTFDAEFSVAAPAKSDRLQFGVNCMFTARALSADTIEIDAVVCPTKRSMTVSGAMADFTADYEAGAGRLSNKTLTIRQQGTDIGTNYSDGTPTQRFPFTLKLSVVRQ